MINSVMSESQNPYCCFRVGETKTFAGIVPMVNLHEKCIYMYFLNRKDNPWRPIIKFEKLSDLFLALETGDMSKGEVVSQKFKVDEAIIVRFFLDGKFNKVRGVPPTPQIRKI